jgi:2-amino-4-hydroxy-6-hydroxymethyldihydropteridine diphosphokinase
MRIELPAVLSLGSNLGDREAEIRTAVDEIAALDGVAVLAASGLYESAALRVAGVDNDAPRFLNAIVIVKSALLPEPLLDALADIELRHGRVRGERWGDRTLDIDIVTFGGLRIDEPALRLPHPRAAARAFVLVPWLELNPDASLPGQGRVRELAAGMFGEVTRYPAEPLR